MNTSSELSSLGRGISPLKTQLKNITLRLQDDRGAGLAEYALLLLLVAVVVVGTVTTFGTTVSGIFTQAAGMF